MEVNVWPTFSKISFKTSVITAVIASACLDVKPCDSNLLTCVQEPVIIIRRLQEFHGGDEDPTSCRKPRIQTENPNRDETQYVGDSRKRRARGLTNARVSTRHSRVLPLDATSCERLRVWKLRAPLWRHGHGGLGPPVWPLGAICAHSDPCPSSRLPTNTLLRTP
jgi:hypothetical protein